MSFISIVPRIDRFIQITRIFRIFAYKYTHFVSHSLDSAQKFLESTECLSYFAESRTVPLPKLNAFSRTNHAHSLLLIEVCSCDHRGARRAASRLASAPAATHGPIKRSLYPAMCTCPCKRAHVRHTLYPECSALFETIKMQLLTRAQSRSSCLKKRLDSPFAYFLLLIRPAVIIIS